MTGKSAEARLAELEEDFLDFKDETEERLEVQRDILAKLIANWEEEALSKHLRRLAAGSNASHTVDEYRQIADIVDELKAEIEANRLTTDDSD